MSPNYFENILIFKQIQKVSLQIYLQALEINVNVNKTRKRDFFYTWEIYSNEMAPMYIIVNRLFI